MIDVAAKHQKRIARKSLTLNRMGRDMFGMPLSEAYRIVFGRDLAERLAELIAQYPNVVAPNFLSWELGCQQNCNTTAGLQVMLIEIENENACHA